MLNQFYKYQSLGNDFILFDWYKKPNQYLDGDLKSEHWPYFVQRLCERRYGIGADGVLVIKNNQQAGMPEMLVFNRDGSLAESCVNGIRCSALHMTIAHRFPQKFSLKMGSRVVDCFFKDTKNCLVATTITDISFGSQQKLEVAGKILTGYIVDVGNPHFIIFDAVHDGWLEQYGSFIEQHELFPNKTNVEFVDPQESFPLIFNLKIFERGCGVTKACSSGAAAVAGLLAQLGMVVYDQRFEIAMPGGSVQAVVLPSGKVILEASVNALFEGTLTPGMMEDVVVKKRDNQIFL